MLFPIVAFVGAGVGTSWLGRTIGTAAMAAVPAAQYVKKERREHEMLLGLNPIREERMHRDGLGLFVFEESQMPTGMAHWAGEYVLTDDELNQFQMAMAHKRHELETNTLDPIIMAEGVRVDLADMSRLRLADEGIRTFLGIKQK